MARVCRKIGAVAGNEVPVPEGARVVCRQAEDLHLDPARGGGIGEGAGLIVAFHVDEVELDRVRRAQSSGPSASGTFIQAEVLSRSAT
jgi:hypothetical protein